MSIEDLVTKALVESDNMAYNRLVQLAGHDELHDTLLSSFGDTELNTPYIKDEWRALTRGNSTFAAPRIRLSEGERTRTLDATPSRAPRSCAGRSACTSPGSLNDLMFDAVESGRLGLSVELSNLLAGALGAPKRSGSDFSNSIMSQIGAPGVQVFGKHGYNGTSYTQTALLRDPSSPYVYVVTATCEGGSRSSLNDVGRALGELINSGALAH
jgi:beta-lactamase class A